MDYNKTPPPTPTANVTALHTNTKALVAATQKINASTVMQSVQDAEIAKANSVPANWDIFSGETDDLIVARNRISLAEFKGTRPAFSKLLRGE